MLELYFAPTPNGWKTTIMLEECGLDYELKLVNIGSGEQFKEPFLSLSPNARIPALIDRQPKDDRGRVMPNVELFESGSILTYLGEKTGLFIGESRADFHRINQWLHWQMANLGPIGGQVSHFINYAPDGNDYSKQRYLNEYDRLLAVMNYQLQKTPYLGGEYYSIADIACFPWLLPYKNYGIALSKFTHLKRWYDELKQRPALRRDVDVGKDWRPKNPPDASMREVLFKQSSEQYKDK